MKIKKEKLPEDSLIESGFYKIDYFDNYTCEINYKGELGVENCALSLFGQYTNWIMVLLRIRNFIVKYLGLKYDYEKYMESFNNKTIPYLGKRYGAFKVCGIKNNELLFGENDKHLDFKASVILDKNGDVYKVQLATVVKYNNLLGRVYIYFIKPFHKIIVKYSLRKMIVKYKNQNNEENK